MDTRGGHGAKGAGWGSGRDRGARDRLESLQRLSAMLSRRHLCFVSLSLTLPIACAAPSPAHAASDPGYELRIDGNDVSLRLTRDLTVPEFLRMAQTVTHARYVYQPKQVADAGPVRLVGQIRCQRSEFAGVVVTMMHVCGLRAEARGEGDMQYVQVESATKR